MLPIAKKFYFVLALGALCIGYLGSRVLFQREERVLIEVINTDDQKEDLYGVKLTPSDLIDDYEMQNEQIARRIGEATPNFPRKEHIYDGGFWEYIKNFLYNKWLSYKDTQKVLEEANVQEMKDASEQVKSAFKEKNLLTQAAEKIDEKFEEVKDEAKEKIKEGVKTVLHLAKDKAKDKTESHDDSSIDVDDSCLDGTESSWTQTTEGDIQEAVNRAVNPQKTMEEIKETLKEVANLGMENNKNKEDILDASKSTIEKKFDEIKEGAKGKIKDSVHSVLGMKKKGEDKLADIKEEVQDVQKVWEDAKKKLDEKFDSLKEGAKEMMVEELEKVSGEKINKKELPEETVRLIDEKVDESVKKSQPILQKAKGKLEETFEGLNERAKAKVKSGFKRFYEKAAETVKSLFSKSDSSSSSSSSSSEESHEIANIPENITFDNLNLGTGAQPEKKRSRKADNNTYTLRDDMAVL